MMIKLLRTQEEIIARIGTRADADPLGFERGDYIDYLDFKHAKPFLKNDVTAK